MPQVPGIYGFSLKVFDGQQVSEADTVQVTVLPLGDVDADGDVDPSDLQAINSAVGMLSDGFRDLRDLDSDGTISTLDVEQGRLLCGGACQSNASTTPAPDQLSLIASAGPDVVVRLGSVVTLNGTDSGKKSSAKVLRYQWVQKKGPSGSLREGRTSRPKFVPRKPGVYEFSLNVTNGKSASNADMVRITVPRLGDVDGDGDVDRNDVRLVTRAMRSRAGGVNDLRDLDGDRVITAKDERKVTQLCTRVRCVSR